jgi:hypothetical protein
MQTGNNIFTQNNSNKPSVNLFNTNNSSSKNIMSPNNPFAQNSQRPNIQNSSNIPPGASNNGNVQNVANNSNPVPSGQALFIPPRNQAPNQANMPQP